MPQPQQWGVTRAGSRSPPAFLSPSDCRGGCSDRLSAPNACQSPVSVKVKGLKVAAETLLNESRDRPRSWESTVWRETPWAGVRRRVSAALPGQGHLGAGGCNHGGLPESSHSTPSLSLPTHARRCTPDGIAVRGPLTGIQGALSPWKESSGNSYSCCSGLAWFLFFGFFWFCFVFVFLDTVYFPATKKDVLACIGDALGFPEGT